MTPRLTAITGPLKGQIFPLNEAAISLGRESANRICVSDLSVSRRHCVFEKEEEQFRVTDLNSRNGTFIRINGEVELKPGDMILIGRQLFRFEV